MPTNFQNKNTKFSDEEAQGMGFYCDELILKKVDLIANALHWPRNTLIIHALMHILNLVKLYNNQIIPDFVILTRALQQAGRCNFHFKEELSHSEKSKKIKTGINIHQSLFKKISHVADSIGYSRNSFMVESVIHAINIIKDEQADPIPNIVKMARIIAPSITLPQKDTSGIFDGMSIKQVQPFHKTTPSSH